MGATFACAPACSAVRQRQLLQHALELNRCFPLAPLSGNKWRGTLFIRLRRFWVMLQVILWELMTNKEPWGDMTPMQVI